MKKSKKSLMLLTSFSLSILPVSLAITSCSNTTSQNDINNLKNKYQQLTAKLIKYNEQIKQNYQNLENEKNNLKNKSEKIQINIELKNEINSLFPSLEELIEKLKMKESEISPKLSTLRSDILKIENNEKPSNLNFDELENILSQIDNLNEEYDTNNNKIVELLKRLKIEEESNENSDDLNDIPEQDAKNNEEETNKKLDNIDNSTKEEKKDNKKDDDKNKDKKINNNLNDSNNENENKDDEKEKPDQKEISELDKLLKKLGYEGDDAKDKLEERIEEIESDNDDTISTILKLDLKTYFIDGSYSTPDSTPNENGNFENDPLSDEAKSTILTFSKTEDKDKKTKIEELGINQDKIQTIVKKRIGLHNFVAVLLGINNLKSLRLSDEKHWLVNSDNFKDPNMIDNNLKEDGFAHLRKIEEYIFGVNSDNYNNNIQEHLLIKKFESSNLEQAINEFFQKAKDFSSKHAKSEVNDERIKQALEYYLANFYNPKLWDNFIKQFKNETFLKIKFTKDENDENESEYTIADIQKILKDVEKKEK
ncbi:coiled-coil domain-containing protein [[Mycoplasma] collis]|uniref:coiled-coil domain-containing protein n=1 Tax=[Mycoplasma] collis TaxID=2127 RepID=UPI00051BB7B3|nr:hypothetical protein [[Mycoplasma] collis]